MAALLHHIELSYLPLIHFVRNLHPRTEISCDIFKNQILIFFNFSLVSLFDTQERYPGLYMQPICVLMGPYGPLGPLETIGVYRNLPSNCLRSLWAPQGRWVPYRGTLLG
jgi:hypothetical protein